jgi:hypothetical protein
MDNPDKLATQDTGRRQTKSIWIVHCFVSLRPVSCCQFIWIVHCFVCLRPVSFVPYLFIWIVDCFVGLPPVSCVASLSGLTIVLFVFVMFLTMDNPDKLEAQDTCRRQTKQWTIQINCCQFIWIVHCFVCISNLIQN